MLPRKSKCKVLIFTVASSTSTWPQWRPVAQADAPVLDADQLTQTSRTQTQSVQAPPQSHSKDHRQPETPGSCTRRRGLPIWWRRRTSKHTMMEIALKIRSRSTSTRSASDGAASSMRGDGWCALACRSAPSRSQLGGAGCSRPARAFGCALGRGLELFGVVFLADITSSEMGDSDD